MMYLILKNLDDPEKSKEESVVTMIQEGIASVGLQGLTLTDDTTFIDVKWNYIYIEYTKTECNLLEINICKIPVKTSAFKLTANLVALNIYNRLAEMNANRPKVREYIDDLIDNKHLNTDIIAILPYVISPS